MALQPVNGDLAQQYLQSTLGLPIRPLQLPAGALAMGGPAVPMAGAIPTASDATPNMSPTEPMASIAPKPQLTSEPNMSVQPAPVPKPIAATAPPFDFNSSFAKVTKGESGGAGGAQNKDTGASGVFQLMPDQARAMGYSPEDVRKMSPEEQRDVLFPKYLARHGLDQADIQSDQDMALSIAAPGYVKSSVSPDTVLYRKGSKEAAANPNWQDASGNVTVASLDNYYGIDPTTKTAAGRTGNTNFINAPIVTPGKHEEARTLEEGVDTSDLRAGLPAKQEAAAGQIQGANQPVIDAALAEQAQRQAVQDQLQADRDAKAKEKADAQALYEDSKNKVAQAQKDYEADKAPAPFGGNVVSQILATIGQAMGAYGASITHTRNFASDMINQYLDAEQKRWEQNHLTLKYKVDTAKDLSAQQRADFNLAKAEHSLAQREWMNSELQTATARKGTAEAQRNLGLMLKDNQQHYEADDERLQMAAKDHVKITTQDTAETSRAPTPEETTARGEAAIKGGVSLESVEGARGQAGLPPRTPLNKDQQGIVDKVRPDLEKVTRAKQALRGLNDVLDKYGKGADIPGLGSALENTQVPFTGTNVLNTPIIGGIAHNLPGLGSGGIGNTDEARLNNQAVSRAITLTDIAQTSPGIEKSPALKELSAALQRYKRPEELRTYVERANAALAEQERQIIEGSTDDAKVRRHLYETTDEPPKPATTPYKPPGAP